MREKGNLLHIEHLGPNGKYKGSADLEKSSCNHHRKDLIRQESSMNDKFKGKF